MDRITSVIIQHNVIGDKYDCTVTYMIGGRLYTFMEQRFTVIEDAYAWSFQKFEEETNKANESKIRGDV